MTTHLPSDRPIPFFCADAARQAEELLIGTAPNCQTYVFVECPFPWASTAFESKMIPQNLRALVKLLEQTHLPIRFFLINQFPINQGQKTVDRATVLIYQLPSDQFCSGYQRWSWQVDRLEQVAPLVRRFLSGQVLPSEVRSQQRDLFVCVHGSHDKCCGKYGMPFYRAAIETTAEYCQAHQIESSLIQLWQVSHFGGHRFAPTLLDLPTGRYYGRLDQESFRSILARSGSVEGLKQCYRGWGILPACLQALELQLILQEGWQWLDYKSAHRILNQQPEVNRIEAELSIEQPNGWIHRYQAELIADPQNTVYVKSSCQAACPAKFVKYRVQSLQHSILEPTRLSA